MSRKELDDLRQRWIRETEQFLTMMLGQNSNPPVDPSPRPPTTPVRKFP